MSPARSARDRLASIGSLTGTPPVFDPAESPADPVELFLAWLDEALVAEVPEPRAMTLSTIDADGAPDARAAVSPGDWRLWRLLPTRVEHWQGSPDRRHTRIVDIRGGDGWVREVTVGSQ